MNIHLPLLINDCHPSALPPPVCGYYINVDSIGCQLVPNTFHHHHHHHHITNINPQCHLNDMNHFNQISQINPVNNCNNVNNVNHINPVSHVNHFSQSDNGNCDNSATITPPIMNPQYDMNGINNVTIFTPFSGFTSPNNFCINNINNQLNNSSLSYSISTNVEKPHAKHKFTEEEDRKLTELVTKHGEFNWKRISDEMHTRNYRQCRERWKNYLSPSVCKDPWTREEDALLLRLFKSHGSQWAKIAKSFPKRTDVSLKNRWVVLANHTTVSPSNHASLKRVRMTSSSSHKLNNNNINSIGDINNSNNNNNINNNINNINENNINNNNINDSNINNNIINNNNINNNNINNNNINSNNINNNNINDNNSIKSNNINYSINDINDGNNYRSCANNINNIINNNVNSCYDDHCEGKGDSSSSFINIKTKMEFTSAERVNLIIRKARENEIEGIKITEN